MHARRDGAYTGASRPRAGWRLTTGGNVGTTQSIADNARIYRIQRAFAPQLGIRLRLGEDLFADANSRCPQVSQRSAIGTLRHWLPAAQDTRNDHLN